MPNREILFRGKRLDNGEWVEGVPIKTHIGVFMVYEENPHFCSQYGYMEIDGLCPVDPATVGQYTGLKDRNGKRIFEGDIVKGRDGRAYAVIYGRNIAGFMTTGTGVLSTPYHDGETMKNYVVVGNVHDDNPKLLEGE